MYWFLLKPRWILSHIFIIVVVVTMVNLGFWQLVRLDERKTQNAEVTVAMREPEVPITSLLSDGTASTPDQIDAATYRAVFLSGTYRVDEQVLINNRTNDGAPGFWVVTPLVLSDGTAVAINRGWIPFTYTADGPWGDFAPPEGTVSVRGLIRPSQVRETDGLVASPKDAATGTLRALARVDVGRLSQQSAEQLWPVYINLDAQDPPFGVLPVPTPPPELSEGTHLGYALQWFAFSLLTIIVYPLLLRRHARRLMEGTAEEIGDVVEVVEVEATEINV